MPHAWTMRQHEAVGLGSAAERPRYAKRLGTLWASRRAAWERVAARPAFGNGPCRGLHSASASRMTFLYFENRSAPRRPRWLEVEKPSYTKA